MSIHRHMEAIAHFGNSQGHVLLAVHEAGHAVADRVLGHSGIRVTLTPEGGATAISGYAVNSPEAARRYAVALWAGRVAVEMLLPRKHRLIAGVHPDVAAPESDESRLIALAMKWGGDSPCDWSTACRDRAAAILAAHFQQLVECAKILARDNYLSDGQPPLSGIRPQPQIADFTPATVPEGN